MHLLWHNQVSHQYRDEIGLPVCVIGTIPPIHIQDIAYSYTRYRLLSCIVPVTYRYRIAFLNRAGFSTIMACSRHEKSKFQ
jgi:hypothetical protein